uniref:Putative tick transposon n=1 Tax=Rhipicephalus microplus TaxID=6941 RepID=A0A6G5AJW4_RHIMP
MHKIAHNLKKVAQQVNVKAVFTAPRKLSRLCKLSVPPSRPTLGCTTKHANKFRDCTCNVMYQLLLSCGRYCVDQTGRCINERLRKHMHNVDHYIQGCLSVHYSTCGCRPIFSECTSVARCRECTTCEIIEAEKICSLKDACVNTPSVTLTNKESCFFACRCDVLMHCHCVLRMTIATGNCIRGKTFARIIVGSSAHCFVSSPVPSCPVFCAGKYSLSSFSTFCAVILIPTFENRII